MGYAAYREHPGTVRARTAVPFCVLEVTVACADALRVRRAVALCEGAGVLRCEPLLHERSACENGAPRVRLMVRLPLGSYAEVVHRLLDCVPNGEIGRLLRWRDHLARCSRQNHGL